MAATTLEPSATRSALAGGSLPRWVTPTVLVASIVIALLLNRTTGLAGWFGTSLVAALLFLAVQTTWSFRVEGRRHAVDRLATTLVYSTFIAAIVPLVSVIWTVLSKGLRVMSWGFLTQSMRNVSPRSPGGGAGHAIVGTLEQVAIAAAFAIPIGVLAAVFLVEYGRGPLARAISFFVDVMTGIPSIVAGLFIFTAFVLGMGLERSGFAAALALAILMLPVIIRTTEEMLRIVPNDLREASYALGVPKWRTIAKVVLPTALAGIVTGVVLSVARVIGETAPLLVTAGITASLNINPFSDPMATLPVFVYYQYVTPGIPQDPFYARAWAGALTLILIVMGLNAIGRLIAWKFAPKSGR